VRFREIERAAAVAERGEGPAEMGGGSKRPLTPDDGLESTMEEEGRALEEEDDILVPSLGV
jgi:hypothetical protein